MSLRFQLQINLNESYQATLTVISFRLYLLKAVMGAPLEAINHGLPFQIEFWKNLSAVSRGIIDNKALIMLRHPINY